MQVSSPQPEKEKRKKGGGGGRVSNAKGVSREGLLKLIMEARLVYLARLRLKPVCRRGEANRGREKAHGERVKIHIAKGGLVLFLASPDAKPPRLKETPSSLEAAPKPASLTSKLHNRPDPVQIRHPHPHSKHVSMPPMGTHLRRCRLLL